MGWLTSLPVVFLTLLAPWKSAMGRRQLHNPCRSAPFQSMPFCNPSLSMDARVEDAISRMNLSEKIGALGTVTPAIASLGLPAYNWWNEATSGVASEDHEATKFPFPITTGMSFNRSLWRATGRQIALEARALMNIGREYSTYWTPVINLAREPRWGRNIETPGEDPMLTGEYAEHFVKGFQEAPEDPSHLLASACCKHYVANEMESTTEADGEHEDREHVDTKVSMQDLVDSYMRPFQACVEKGRVSSLMCSYNSMNGVPTCANDWLLQTVARDTWGFDGYITSDCDADNDVFVAHHFTSTAEEAVRDILKAGTDVDCGNFVPQNAAKALDKGTITVADIDERLRYLMRVRMRLGHFDPESWMDSVPASTVCSKESLDMSYEAVAQSAVLLKNVEATLPLAKGADLGLVAVIGPAVNLSKSDSNYYGPGKPCGGHFWSLQDALEIHGQVKTRFAAGVPSVTSEDMSGIANATAVAAEADVVVLAVGTGLAWSREGYDARSINFTKAQATLIDKVAAAAKWPIIVVLLTATPLDLSAILSNRKIGAVLHLGQPSVAILGAGPVLFGDRVPAGRMIQTVYEASYQDQISIFDFNMRPGPSTFARPDCTDKNASHCPRGTNPGRTYRFYTGKAVVPFGFGLSYTQFRYEVISAPRQVSLAPLTSALAAASARGVPFITQGDILSVDESRSWRESVAYRIKVTNLGAPDADDVVLGFIVPPGAGKDGVPLRQLFGFQRVHVGEGESVIVTLYPELTDFTTVAADGTLKALAGDYRFEFGVVESHAFGMGFATAPWPLRAEGSHSTKLEYV